MSMNFRGGWSNLKFFKSGTEIKEKAGLKIKDLKSKREERQERIRAICKTKGLEVAGLLSDLDAFTYNTSNSNFNMNVGEMEQLKSEARALKEEKNTLDELEVVHRNVVGSESYQLSFEQLEYLGF